jgi:hypothetical protein
MDSAARVCPFNECGALIKDSLTGYGFCSKHICCFKGCLNSIARISQAEACWEHTCTYPGCISSVQLMANNEYSRACAHHTCIYATCINAVLEERQLCEQHSCKRDDCRLPTCQDSRTLCALHMCAQPECKDSCESLHSLFCFAHRCVRCPNRRLEGSAGCPHHTCIFSGCTELSDDNGRGVCRAHQCGRCPTTTLIVSEEHKLCQKHMCNRFECTKPSRDNLAYCADHSCTYYDDCQEKQCQREGSIANDGHPLCVHHTCTRSKCKNARQRHNDLCSSCLLAASQAVEKDKVPEKKTSPPAQKRTPQTFASKKNRVTLRQRPYCVRPRTAKT